MKQTEAKLLGSKDRKFSVSYAEFETLKEAIADAGGEEKLLARVNGWTAAHGTFGDARSLIVEATHEVTNIPFLTKKETVTKDGKETVVESRDTTKDSDAAYVARALAAQPEAFDKIQALINERAKGYSYKDGEETITIEPLANSLKARVRTPGSGKSGVLAKKYIEAAKLFLIGDGKGNKKDIKKFNTALSKAGLGTFTPVAGVPLEDSKNLESLGWLCKAWADKQDMFSGM